MRKGQIVIIDRAKQWELPEKCIEILSREDLTIKALNSLLWCFHSLCSKAECEDGVIEAYLELSLLHNDYRMLFIRYAERKGSIVTMDDISHFTSDKAIYSYFSKGDIVCKSILGAEIIIILGYHSYTKTVLDFIENDELPAVIYRCSCFADAIAEMKSKYSDLDEFLKRFDIIEYLTDRFGESINFHLDACLEGMISETKFSIRTDNNIPQDILDMKPQYNMVIDCPVSERRIFAYANTNSIWMNVTNYKRIQVGPHFDQPRCFDKAAVRGTHRLIFNNRDNDFIIGFKTKSGFKYKPASVRELFADISIGSCKESTEDAWSVVNFLCKTYGTYIFKDLYTDFLASGGLLVPILIKEAALYKTKDDMFKNFYKMDIKGDWNKRNVNLTYLILKLYKRMTADGFSRAMSIKGDPHAYHAGRNRHIMLFSLYEAMYNVNVSLNHTLRDALIDEYKHKEIQLLSPNRTENIHTARYRNAVMQDTSDFKIKKNTKFKNLIRNMPSEYELIDTPERLKEEGEIQHHCVARYGSHIASDSCMIYSTVFNKKRFTIEIGRQNDKFHVNQCRGVCNKKAPLALSKSLKEVVENINNMN